jgi:leucyl aminopeptidase (aminopeptidase T)
MDWTAAELAKVANSIVRVSLDIKAGEEVAIVADHGSDFAVVDALIAAACGVGAEVTSLVMPRRARAGAPANEVVSAALLGANAIIAPTSTALTFTPALNTARQERGARVIVMSGTRREQLLSGAGLADYDQVYAITRQLADVLEAGQTIRVTSESGSDLTASIDGVAIGCGAAFARKPGEISAFPSGEAWMSPVTGSGSGVLIADGSAHMLGFLSQPIRVTFEHGRAVSIEGGDQADRLREIIGGVENGDNLGELSVGTNPSAGFTGNITEDKKRLGTVHFALGNSVAGGDVHSPLHLDMLIRVPTVEVDGEPVVTEGQLVALRELT